MKPCISLKKSQIIIIVLSILLTTGIGRAADTNALSVAATVLSRSLCWFNSSASTLNFGNLDPSNPVDRTVTTSFQFLCISASPQTTFYISDNGGQHKTGLNVHRMQHATASTEYLPYILTLDPVTDSIPIWLVWRTLTLTGTVKGPDYQDAMVGNYSDTVVVSIVP